MLLQNVLKINKIIITFALNYKLIINNKNI